MLQRARFSIGPHSLRSLSMLRDMLQALVVRLLNFVSSRHSSSFETRNDNQVNSARTLTIVFADTVAFTRFAESISEYPSDQVSKLGSQGYFNFSKHRATLKTAPNDKLLKASFAGKSKTKREMHLQRAMLENIGVIFGLKTLSTHIGHLYEYSIFSEPHHSRYDFGRQVSI